jgi:Spy/CpxP family protein refolding chaperone
MRIYYKTGLAFLVLALSCSPILAQQGAPSTPASGQQGGWGATPQGPRSAMGRVRADEDSGWWSYRHDGFGPLHHRGMRGFGMARREFGVARLLRDPELRKQVGITDEQAAALRQNLASFRKTEIQDRANLEVKRIDLQNLLAADNPDRAAIDSKLQEVGAAQLALEKAAIDYRLTMRNAISPAQREKLRQLLREQQRLGFGPAGRGPRGGMQSPPPPNPQPQP